MRLFWATLKISFQRALAYRAASVVWILFGFVWLLLWPLMWLAILRAGGTLANYTALEVILYFVLLFLQLQIFNSHVEDSITTDVRDGELTLYLLRPLNYLRYLWEAEWGFRLHRILLLLPLAAAALALLSFGQHWPTFWQWLGYALLLLPLTFLRFLLSSVVGLFSLWFTEMSGWIHFFWIVESLLAGELSPPEFMPAGWHWLIFHNPFYLVGAFPLRVLLGKVGVVEYFTSSLELLLWAVLVLGVVRFLWRRGVKRFTGIGL